MPIVHTPNISCLFQNFVTGKANELAHAASVQVVDSPGAICNPLFIYGGVGLGKTHLIHAIGNQFKLQHRQAKICFVHATTYVTNVVHAYRSHTLDEFRQYFNSLDLLLIDDIQLIGNKIATQPEFFHTLDSLIGSNKQVVITCDTCPDDLLEIEPRLISRFSGGLTVAIEPPEVELRAAILQQKAITSGTPIGDDVAYFVAKNVNSDIRKLEGALNRVVAYARFHKRPITVDLVNEAIFTTPIPKETAD